LLWPLLPLLSWTTSRSAPYVPNFDSSRTVTNLQQLTCFIGPLSSDGCAALTDFKCHCQKGASLLATVQPCVVGACSAADQATTIAAVQKTCQDAGVPIEIPGASSAVASASQAASSAAASASAVQSSAAAAASSAAGAASSAVASAVSSAASRASSAAGSATSAASSVRASASASASQFTGAAAPQATKAAGLLGAAALAMLAL
jgi:cobalamin biosynthesis Mg chelatase CobN